MATAQEIIRPIPANEAARLLALSSFDPDYSNLQTNFENLTSLAAKISGNPISLVNLIDSFTQWTVSNHGMELRQMDREESICQYTIMNDDHFEITDMSQDDRSKDFFYVRNPLNLRHYFGVPLKTHDGHNIGALCVLDSNAKKLNDNQISQLKLLAQEVVDKLTNLKILQKTKNELDGVKQRQRKLAHDIRGPLSGISGIIEIIKSRGYKNKLFDVMEYLFMIDKSNNEVLNLTDEILVQEKLAASDDFNLLIFKDKLDKLYTPQAKAKNIFFKVSINPEHQQVNFSRSKLLQITGNLISNAIKFSSDYGTVTVKLNLVITDKTKSLKINVSDNGNGLSDGAVEKIMTGELESSSGTRAEKGYGLGLPMVVNDIRSLGGSTEISSQEGWGTTFEIVIPLS